MASDTSLLPSCAEAGSQEQLALRQKRKTALGVIKELFQAWCTPLFERHHGLTSVPIGAVRPFGSFLLGVEDAESDIDLVCVAPACVTREDFEAKFIRVLAEHGDVTSLNCIFSAKVPLVKLEIDDVSVDLLFVSLYTCSEVTSEWQDFWDDRYVMNCDEATALSLNGLRNTEMLLQLVPNISTFRSVLRSVRTWAKKRGLYSNILGYLGGAAWSILVVKVCMTYPDLTPASVLCNFFKFFSAWDWSRPVSLSPYEEPLYLPHWKTWSPLDRSHVTILTPAFPVSNAAYGACEACPRMLTEELELAAKITEDVLNGQEDWSELFLDLDFFQQFSYFLEIDVVAAERQEFSEWHGLVLSKFKAFLSELETLAPKTQVRLYPKSYHCEEPLYRHGAAYFIGLRFPPIATSMDLRMPVINFCKRMEELRKGKESINIRVQFQRRSQLPEQVLRQLQSPRQRTTSSRVVRAK